MKYNRRILGTLAGLFLCGASPTPPQSEGKQAATQSALGAQRKLRPAPIATARPIRKFAAYPAYNPDPCYHAEDHDAADLCAQWRAALAAEEAARQAGRATFWSIIATILSAVGVGGLIYTLCQTHRALRQAQRGNLIAQRANARATRQAIAADERSQEANRLSLLSLRPWIQVSIGFTKISFEQSLKRDAGRGTKVLINFDVTLRNIGQTPAENVDHAYCLFDESNGEEGRLWVSEEHVSHFKITLLPQEEQVIGAYLEHELEVDAFGIGFIFARIAVQASYDVSGKRSGKTAVIYSVGEKGHTPGHFPGAIIARKVPGELDLASISCRPMEGGYAA